MGSIMDKIAGNYEKNPADAPLSPEAELLIKQSFGDINEGEYFDYHMHILGLGTNNSGIWVSKDLFSLLHPADSIKTQSYINAAGIENQDEADVEYLQQLITSVNFFPKKGKFCVLALDKCYTTEGEPDDKNSKLYVPNEWVYNFCNANKDRFIPCISVNPYRRDAVEELEKWALKGVKMVKWMPATMGMDASNVLCEPFYEKMKEHDMVLLTHTGKEDNVPVTKFQPLNNPLLFRKPLDMGVKVVMAHCASAGKNPDLEDKNKSVENYELFYRLMDEPKYEGLLFGDISALTQVNRMGAPLQTVLERTEHHHRLIHGSDYPLPAINVLISTRMLRDFGYIEEKDREPLNEIYNMNPLLFDYVTKRSVKHPKDANIKFPATIFKYKEELGISLLK